VRYPTILRKRVEHKLALEQDPGEGMQRACEEDDPDEKGLEERIEVGEERIRRGREEGNIAKVDDGEQAADSGWNETLARPAFVDGEDVQNGELETS
jgi:hypothetical protein